MCNVYNMKKATARTFIQGAARTSFKAASYTDYRVCCKHINGLFACIPSFTRWSGITHTRWHFRFSLLRFRFIVRVKALKHQETVRRIRFDVKLCLRDCCFRIHSIPVHKLIIDTETISTV